MEVSDITGWLSSNLPQVILIVGGLLAIAVAVSYAKDKDSGKYKALMVLGFIFGIFMALEAATNFGHWNTVTSVIIAVAAFTLIIRPFREVHFAVILGLFVMVVVYIWLGGLTEVSGIDISFLADNPVRIIVAFIIGGLCYAIFNFGEAIVKLFGKILNWWPLLFLLGCVCVVEGAMMFLGYGSIVDYINIQQIIC
ncbi:hypothetical protein [Candidatus Methanoprimaticola sp. MG2]|uniref:hypothetical protein n=1 Tax=Candidatus Methanoprimaticola sp. MG2 TaxID=3228838 RepID=UPI0039C6CF83